MVVFVGYKNIPDKVQSTWMRSPRFDEPIAETQNFDLRAENLMPTAEQKPDHPGAPFYELVEAVSNTSCPIEEQTPGKSNGDIWGQFPVGREVSISK